MAESGPDYEPWKWRRETDYASEARFNEVDIAFDAIDGELAKLVSPKLSLADVLDRLRKRLVEQHARGGDSGLDA